MINALTLTFPRFAKKPVEKFLEQKSDQVGRYHRATSHFEITYPNFEIILEA